MTESYLQGQTMKNTESNYLITVKYKKIKDHHVFTSSDLPGFIIASTDKKKALKDVAPVIERLLKDNLNIESSVNLMQTLGTVSNSFDAKHFSQGTKKENLPYVAYA